MEYFGYIYRTTNLKTGKIYIGKKSYLHKKKRKLTKKELSLQLKGRKKKYEVTYIDSNWRSYYGSSVELKEDIEKLGKENFTVEILKECEDSISLTYWEIFFQMSEEVLFKDTYNGNIMGRFFRGKIKY